MSASECIAAYDQLKEKLGDPDPWTLAKLSVKVGNNGKIFEDVIPFRFKIIPPEEPGLRRSPLYQLILESGGTISTIENDEYCITVLNDLSFVLDKSKDLVLPPDIYSSRLIYDLIWRANGEQPMNMLDLSKYLISPSRFKQYNPFLILNRDVKWSELETAEKNQGVQVRAQQVASLLLEADRRYEPTPPPSPPRPPSTPPVSSLNEVEHSDADNQEEPAGLEPGEVDLDPPSPTTTEVLFPSNNRESSKNVAATADEGFLFTQEIGGDDFNQEMAEEEPEQPELPTSRQSPIRPEPRPALPELIPSPGKDIQVNVPRVVPIVPMVTRGVAGPANRRYFGKRSVAKREKQPVSKDGWNECRDESEMEDVDFDENSNDSDCASTKSRSLHFRALYSEEEDRLLVTIIRELKAFKYTKGKSLYIQMEESKLFKKKRGWQSLYNRFKNHILKDLVKNKYMKYGMTKHDFKVMQAAMQEAKFNAHSNVCPDYKKQLKKFKDLQLEGKNIGQGQEEEHV